jgi:hypothetical protein
VPLAVTVTRIPREGQAGAMLRSSAHRDGLRLLLVSAFKF